ncbi:MAG: division/cell wall cluster transcriptional repressor MraZ [Terracidiphilus sp.]
MLRGSIYAKTDEKGRLKLPADFKQLYDATSVTKFYITSEDGKKAQIWALPEWEKREKKLLRSSTMNQAVAKYLSLTSYYGQQVEIDNQGRVLLSQLLRRTAKLDAEVLVSGQLDHLVVENSAQADEYAKSIELTSEDRQAIDALFSEGNE